MRGPLRWGAPTPRTIRCDCRGHRSLPNSSSEPQGTGEGGGMALPAPPVRSLRDLRQLTPARVALGRSGASLPTLALLEFTLDHARARDAVHASFDVAAILSGLQGLGLEALAVSSCAADRTDYLKRPDRGRKLDGSSQDRLMARHRDPRDCAFVIGDGLSPSAVSRHAVELVRNLLPRLTAAGIA